MQKRLWSLGIFASLILAFGCSTGPEARPKVSYRVSAKENFIKGKKAFDDEDFLEAIEYFKFVKNKFPYSAYATESDLLIADCHFGRDRYIEAADAFATFIKLHPKHAKVPYATFSIGLCHYKRMPEDWWFAPPAYELDQREVKRAINKLSSYLEQYPDDENVKKGRELLDICLRRMASWVHYVMLFNHKNERTRGALWRAQELLDRYPGSGFDDEALLVKAQSLALLGDLSGARTAVKELVERYPTSEHVEDAREVLTTLSADKSEGKEVPKP